MILSNHRKFYQLEKKLALIEYVWEQKKISDATPKIALPPKKKANALIDARELDKEHIRFHKGLGMKPCTF